MPSKLSIEQYAAGKSAAPYPPLVINTMAN
jgi:hypothetical protein